MSHTEDETNTKWNKRTILRLLIFMIPLLPLGIDFYTPSLPLLAHVFHAKYSMIQFSLTTLLIGFVLGEFLIGPITDTFGRKKILALGMAGIVVLSFSLSFYTSIEMFPAMAGSAAALLGLMIKVEGGVVSAVGSYFEVPSTWVLSIVMLIITTASMCGHLLIKNHMCYRPEKG